MATGDLDIALLSYSSFPLAIQNANMQDLRIIADEFQDGADGYYSAEFMVLKDGPINKIEDLKGKIDRSQRQERRNARRGSHDARQPRPV